MPIEQDIESISDKDITVQDNNHGSGCGSVPDSAKQYILLIPE